MRIEIIDSIEKLGTLSEEWNQVLAASRADTVFLTSDWLISWWKGYQPSGRILCLAVRDDTGKALGFAPFYIQQKKMACITYKALLFLGDGTDESEYMDIFCIKGQEDVCYAMILSWLSNNIEQWDVCELNIIPEESSSLAYQQKWALENGYHLAKSAYYCSHIQLPEDYEEYLASLSKNHRSQVRNLYNRAIKKGQARYMALDAPGLLEQGLRNLYDLHTRRWNSVGQPGSFVDSGRIGFYKDMTLSFSDRGWLRFRRLSILDRPAAIQIGFVYNGVYSFLQEGYDPELGKWRPGTVLRALVIRELIEDGVKVYDFLGFPTPAKDRWNTEIQSCYSLTVARNSVRARAATEIPEVLSSIKDKLRNITPDSVIRMKRKLRERLKRK